MDVGVCLISATIMPSDDRLFHEDLWAFSTSLLVPRPRNVAPPPFSPTFGRREMDCLAPAISTPAALVHFDPWVDFIELLRLVGLTAVAVAVGVAAFATGDTPAMQQSTIPKSHGA